MKVSLEIGADFLVDRTFKYNFLQFFMLYDFVEVASCMPNAIRIFPLINLSTEMYMFA